MRMRRQPIDSKGVEQIEKAYVLFCRIRSSRTPFRLDRFAGGISVSYACVYGLCRCGIVYIFPQRIGSFVFLRTRCVFHIVACECKHRGVVFFFDLASVCIDARNLRQASHTEDHDYRHDDRSHVRLFGVCHGSRHNRQDGLFRFQAIVFSYKRHFKSVCRVCGGNFIVKCIYLIFSESLRHHNESCGSLHSLHIRTCFHALLFSLLRFIQAFYVVRQALRSVYRSPVADTYRCIFRTAFHRRFFRFRIFGMQIHRIFLAAVDVHLAMSEHSFDNLAAYGSRRNKTDIFIHIKTKEPTYTNDIDTAFRCRDFDIPPCGITFALHFGRKRFVKRFA